MTLQQIQKVRGAMHPKVFAKLLGVTPQAVYSWELGRRNPSGVSLTLLKMLQRDRKGTLRMLYRVSGTYIEVA